jgi:hypothetical protein
LQLEVSTRLVGDICVIDVRGRIALGEGSTMLREGVRELSNQNQRKILLNLHHVGTSTAPGSASW